LSESITIERRNIREGICQMLSEVSKLLERCELV